MKVINSDNTTFASGSVVDGKMLTDYEWELRLTTDTEPPAYVYLNHKEVQVLWSLFFNLIEQRVPK